MSAVAWAAEGGKVLPPRVLALDQAGDVGRRGLHVALNLAERQNADHAGPGLAVGSVG